MINNWSQLHNSIINTLNIIDSMSHNTGHRDYQEIIENSEIYYLFDYQNNEAVSHNNNQYAIDAFKEIFEYYGNCSSLLILISHLKNPEYIISQIINSNQPCAHFINYARSCIINYYIPSKLIDRCSERFPIRDLDISRLRVTDSSEMIGHDLCFFNNLLPDIIPNEVRVSLYILSEYELEVLLNVLTKSINIIKTYFFSSCISIENKIKLLKLSSSDHLSKILTFSIIHDTNINANIISDDVFLVELFQTLYIKGDFNYWMNYVNSYPCRFPNIQVNLGKALAIINSPKALDSYLNSIILHNNSLDHSYTNSREPVMHCLTSFKQHSTLALQFSCWEKAFRIWSEWNFGYKQNDLLFSVSSSELDYPVIQYFLNNVTDKEREQFITKTWDDLSSIDNTWHTSHSELISYYYRCASILQLPYHANLAYEKNGSIVDLSLRFNLEISKYNQMLFGA